MAWTWLEVVTDPNSIALAVILLTGWLAYYRFTAPKNKREPPPNVPGLPLLGCALQLAAPAHHLWLSGLARKHGSVFSVNGPFGERIYMLSDAAAAREILRSPTEYKQHDFYRLFDVITVVPSMLTLRAGSAEWTTRRKATRAAFSMAALKAGSLPAIQACASKACDVLASLGSNAAFDADDLCCRVTVDAVCSAAFDGFDAGALEGGKNSPGSRMMRNIAAAMTELILLQVAMPWRKYLPFLPGVRAMKRAVDDTKIIVAEILAHGRAVGLAAKNAPPTPGGVSILQALLNARDEATGARLSESALAADVAMFLVAGTDTTGHTLSMCLYDIALQPDLGDRLFTELTDVLGTPPSVPTSEQLGRLRLLCACVKETLRLRPVAGDGFMRIAPQRPLEVGKYVIPAGSPIWIHPYTMHVAGPDAGGFVDPGRYDPDRWLVAEGAAVPGEANLLPFSVGPKDCPGQSLALLEARAVLAALLSRFQFRVRPGFVLREACDLTLHPAHGVWLQAEPRL